MIYPRSVQDEDFRRRKIPRIKTSPFGFTEQQYPIRLKNEELVRINKLVRKRQVSVEWQLKGPSGSVQSFC